MLVTFAGDTISPSLMSGFDQGAHMVDLLNRPDLTAMAIGNHEYDFGPEVDRQRFAEASFPILGANNIDADGEVVDGAQASILLPVGRFHIGIFGLTTQGTVVKSSPGTVTFRDVEEVADEQAAVLRARGADLDIVIGATTTELDSRRETVRGREAAIGNLVADAMRSMTGADVALTNGGGIRGGRLYEPGTVLTRRDILTELPFGNHTVVLQVTGHDLVAALENGLGKIEVGAGRFPHVSGLSVVYDPGRPAGDRVLEVRRDDAPLDLDATYSLAVNDYNAGGGDGYDFADKPRLIDEYAGKLMATQVIDFIAAQGTVGPVVDGRLKTAE